MQERVFGLDIGTTSIGFAVIDFDAGRQVGHIHRLGVRIFPEARDPDGTPLNQQRRAKRMMRRQLRRRRERRRALNEALRDAGLLPAFDKAKGSAWAKTMTADPYSLRRRGIDEKEKLDVYELGRALYHLAKRRHFKGRDLAEGEQEDVAPDEKEAGTQRDSTLAALHREGVTLGAWLAAKKADAAKGAPPAERRRGVHADRNAVEAEFEALWAAQSRHHPILRDQAFKETVRDAIFFQRPVFWRTGTLDACRFMPGEPPCPKGSWLSQQRRMLEKLNNLALAGGNQRTLEPEERAAILAKLQTQGSMTWGGVRDALKPLYAARGENGAHRALNFNLELGGDKGLPGNKVEADLAKVFGAAWPAHPHKQAIRDAVHERLWSADYGRTRDGKRVVILAETDRKARRAEAVRSFIADFGITQEQAAALGSLTFPAGWEPFSAGALRAFLPKLEQGFRMGDLLAGPSWEAWRDETFPDRERPTGEIRDLLPSPAEKEEQERIAKLRNPTVVRVQNELRKVVNNLIRAHGKPDRIRVELAREVGKSKREREEDQARIRRNEGERKKARADLASKGITDPSRDDIEKWLLWQECGKFDPYSGQAIGFDDLFKNNIFQVEHIWPRSTSLDDGFANKTLCHRDWNLRKNNRMPYEAFGHTEEWAAMKDRMWKNVVEKRMPKGKAVRFCREEPLPDDFTARQLNDTGFAARQAVAFLKRLWPDVGPEAPVSVQTVSGRVTAQLRRLWQLNNILSDDGEKTRADHRHHAVDALVVACAHPGVTQRLSRYWQDKDNPAAQRPHLPQPWPTIRVAAEKAVADIVVSHRVRKKVSGPLHKETTYGDTGQDVTTKTGVYRQFVTRKRVEALTKGELDDIVDDRVRGIVKEWVEDHGGDPKKAFAAYPRLGNGPEIRKVRLHVKQQLRLMAPVSTGYADLGANHHIAIYRRADGKADFEVVSLYEATRRLARHEPVVRRDRGDGAAFVMSLAPGDAVELRNGDKSGKWIVCGIASKGQIELVDHRDASEGRNSKFSPRVGGLIDRNPRKLAVDPIGEIRRAGD
ncbi:MAG: type II CRISPR RNA-guided endonuclease Cas9 [Rhodospirillales bacterium]|nr:type II CRISPR RNA-guided endonuclease Cas9 [Rhodospirillales bacterium]